MLRIQATVSKSLSSSPSPLHSRTYTAGIEIEVPGGATNEQVRQHFDDIYGLLEDSIAARISSQGSSKNGDQISPDRVPRWTGSSRTNNSIQPIGVR